MKHFLTTTLLLSASLLAETGSASTRFACCPEPEQGGRPDAHAPISIMSDHTHTAGEWMLSYRFMRMNMNGMRQASNSVSANEVFAGDQIGYAVTPEQMTMDMHMLGGMLALNDQITLMAMVHYLYNDMDHRINPAAGMLIMANGGSDHFNTQTSGIGDTRLSALYEFYSSANRKAHAGFGLSLPTGSIQQSDTIPVMGAGRIESILPAPMQLGSGTVDLLPSLTFRQQLKRWSYGVQGNATLRLQERNERDYRLGHQAELVSWGGYMLADWISLNGGLSYQWAGELQGKQRDINQGPTMSGTHTVTTAYERNYGGQRLDAIFGFNLLKPAGPLQGHRLALDLRFPLWQDLNGYQLNRSSQITLGWQKAW